MKISVGAKHNAICLLQDFKPGIGDSMQLAAERRLNGFHAVELFARRTTGSVVAITHVEELTVPVFLDHCGGMFEARQESLAKTKTGYSVGIVMTQKDLMNGDEERSAEESETVFAEKMAEILQRSALIGS